MGRVLKNGRTIRQLRRNPLLIYEQCFTLPQSYRFTKKCEDTLRRLIYKGRKSQATGKVVRLECCFLANGALATSVQAYRRFLERLNGATESPLSRGGV